MTIRYAGFAIERRRGDLWIARRRTKGAVYQLASARSLREIQGAIDRYNAALSAEELFAT